MSSSVQLRRRINGAAGSPGAAGSLEGELSLNFPNAAGSSDKPELWAFDGSAWRRVNPDVTISTQSIALGTTGADIGAAYANWATAPGNSITGNVVIATWGTPAQAYVLTNSAAPQLAASWTSLGGAVSFATAAEIHAGTDTTKAINSAILRGEAINTSAGAGDADKLIRLNAQGKINPNMLPSQPTTIVGSKDVTAAPGAYTPTTGDMFYVTAAGTADAGWTGIGGQTVAAGDLVIYDGTNYHLVPNATDLNAYLALAGGTMADGASVTFDTTTGGAGTVIIDGNNGALDNCRFDGGNY